MLPPPEFRAPPPSPVGGAHPHAPGDGDELAGFLSQFLCVPKLNLPHRIFPQEATLWDPAEIDFRTLISPDAGRSEADLLKSAATAFGCFRLANHGIPPGLIAAVEGAAAATFRMPSEEKEKAKAKLAKSVERSWGFEAEEVGEDEEFWWCGAETLPHSFNDLEDKLQELCREIEKIAGKIEDVLLDDDTNMKNAQLLKRRKEGAEGSLICLLKHAPSGMHNAAGIIKHELLRMLVRSWSCSCCLSLHLAGGASEFHVYSKRGWYRFRPGHSAALIVTVGDQLQACSRGMYRHVVGKPVLGQGDDGDCISMAFHCVHGGGSKASQSGKTVTLMEQIMVAAILAILYCLFVS